METEKIKELRRRHLEEMLEEIFYKPMVIVAASSGYGKTTVVRSFFSRQNRLRDIWISLGEDESDDNWLWQKICNQFAGVKDEVYTQLKELGLPRTGQGMDSLFQIIMDNLERPVCLVIDDYQECKSTAINQLLARIGHAGIPNLHIMIISRIQPEFPYEEMMLRGCCSLIDQQALTLSEKETEEIYAINGVKLSEEELKKLSEYTDGWIAAVYLTLYDYKRLGHLRLSLNMIHLLKTAIYDKFPIQIQQILMKMSLFDSFTLEEARYVTEIDVQEIALQGMLESYGFGHFDVHDNKYMVHSLLKTVTRTELDKSGEDKEILYFRDGQWQEKNGNLILAIANYRKCNNDEKVFQLLSGGYNIELYDEAPHFLEEYFQEKPLEVKLKHPAAYLSYIYFLTIRYNVKEGKRLFEETVEGYSRMREQDLPWDYERIQGELCIIKSLLEFNDLEKMVESMRQGYRLLNGRSSAVFQNNLLTYGTPCTLHLYHRKPGDLKKVVELEKKHTSYFMKLIQRVDGGWDELYDAEYELTTGNMEKALELARTVGEKSRFRKQLCVSISSYYIKFWCLIYLGRVQEFEKTMEEMHQEMKGASRPVFIIDYELTYGNAYAKLNQLDKIPEWIYNFNLDECNQIVHNVRSGCMTYGVILRQMRQWVHLDALAEQMLMPYGKSIHLYVMIAAYVYKSIAALHLEGEEKACVWLKQAVDIAKADCIRTSFIDNAKEILPLLQKLSREDNFCRDLIPYCEKYVENCKKFVKRTNEIKLTQREQEIMQLVKEGWHNNEIGEQLHIAIVTVEKTLTNIYRKLGVSNRAAAVAKCGGGGRRLIQTEAYGFPYSSIYRYSETNGEARIQP